MITEHARLDIRPGEEVSFEAAFREAQAIIAAMPGYLGHELRPCIEHSNRYLLLVRWRRLEDHTLG
ncbi:MAG TPA: antibiotic biosynthesis monooxygenase, partial [Gammaproteobacteria bacterium]|nr:antibiotic biosynthesis monooxygenase [Gammaproteobacteria bacterium]